MRKIVLAFITALVASLTAPAMAQSLSATTSTFVQGDKYLLTFDLGSPVPADFEAGTVLITYPDAVFAFDTFRFDLMPSALMRDASLADSILGSPLDPGDETAPGLWPEIGVGMRGFVVTLLPGAEPIPASVMLSSGPLFGVEYSVKAGDNLGPATLRADYELSFLDARGEESNHATLTVTIVPVPEPETWALMLAGITWVGFAAARARRKT